MFMIKIVQSQISFNAYDLLSNHHSNICCNSLYALRDLLYNTFVYDL